MGRGTNYFYFTRGVFMKNTAKSMLVALAFVAEPFNSGWTMQAPLSENEKLLLLAAETGDHATVQRLIYEGVNVNIGNNKFGQSPLCITGDTEIVRMLIDAHIDVNAQHAGSGFTALIVHSCMGRTEIVHLLIAERADVNVHDHDGQTALMKASRSCHKKIVRMLIKAKADVNAQDNMGETALIFSSSNGFTEIVRMLIKAKADVNHQDKLEHTALDMARNATIIQLILEVINNCVAEEWHDCPLEVIKDEIMPFLDPDQK
jgi:uncharacterized protein